MDKSHLNSTKRFGNRVENYAKYRPSYPNEILESINEKMQKKSDYIIADIGSGTGIFSKLLLKTEKIVFGIEPNFEMREYAENYFVENKKFISINGTAENTGLKENSVDLITVAQAFHWFEVEPTKKEFIRIAKDDAYLMLIWNDRKIEKSGFSYEYEEMLKKECSEYSEVSHKNIIDKDIEEFYSPNKVEKIVFSNSQIFNYEELKGRLMSSSYVPVDNKEKMDRILKNLADIFERNSQEGKVKFEYNTTVYMGKIKSNGI